MENCENRNDPDLVQAFLKKWWVESDFKAPNLPLSLRFKGSGCHYTSITTIDHIHDYMKTTVKMQQKGSGKTISKSGDILYNRTS